jgi:hypothetical protein
MEVKTSLIHLGKLKVTEDYQKAILLVFVHGFNVFPQFYFIPRNKPKFQIKVITQDIYISTFSL